MAKKELKKLNKVIKGNLKSHGKTGKAFKVKKHKHGKHCTQECLLGNGFNVELFLILTAVFIISLVVFVG